MIQDISNKFDNAYADRREPKNGDIFFSFKDNKAVMKNEREFFVYEDFDSLSDYIYLFCVDETAFFLIENLTEKNKEYVSYNMNYFREFHPKKYAFAAITAYHLFVWYRDNSFCGRCGEKTVHSKSERAMVCPKCSNIIYPKISPAVIVAVTDKNRLLLTKYAGRDYTNYALIAGFSEIGETLEQTVQREVMEEVGLKVKNITYYDCQPWGFSQSLLMGFFAELDGDDKITLEEKELKEAVWKEKSEIPPKLLSQITLTGTMVEHFRKN